MGARKSAGRRKLLTDIIALLVLATLGVQLGINRWNRLFYDALDRRDGAAG